MFFSTYLIIYSLKFYEELAKLSFKGVLMTPSYNLNLQMYIHV